MTVSIIAILETVVAAAIGSALLALFRMMSRFIKEQRRVNESTRMANRSMQRDVLYRYFRIVVEDGQRITPEEYNHIKECYSAYHANGGNGAGTLMFKKISDNAVIDTGRESH